MHNSRQMFDSRLGYSFSYPHETECSLILTRKIFKTRLTDLVLVTSTTVILKSIGIRFDEIAQLSPGLGRKHPRQWLGSEWAVSHFTCSLHNND